LYPGTAGHVLFTIVSRLSEVVPVQAGKVPASSAHFILISGLLLFFSTDSTSFRYAGKGTSECIVAYHSAKILKKLRLPRDKRPDSLPPYALVS
jgi:hypothetical protein